MQHLDEKFYKNKKKNQKIIKKPVIPLVQLSAKVKKYLSTPAEIVKANEIIAAMAKIQKEIRALNKKAASLNNKRRELAKKKKKNQKVDKKTLGYLSLLERDCKQALLAMRTSKCLLVRGTSSHKNHAYIAKPPANRIPSDTSYKTQEAFDSLLAAAGFKALRKNSIFCSGSFDTADKYGSIYAIFPKDGFQLTWSREYHDLYSDLLQNTDASELLDQSSNILLDNYDAEIYYDIENELSDLEEECFNFYSKPFPKIKYNDPYGALKKADPTFKKWIDILQNVGKQCGTIANAVEDDIIPSTKNFKIFRDNISKIVSGLKFPSTIKNRLANYLKKVDKAIAQLSTDSGISPQKAKKIIVQKHKFQNNDLAAALKTGNEICITGEYYAFSYEHFKTLLRLAVPNVKHYYD